MVPQTCTELYRKQYHNVTDVSLKALNKRFKQSIFPFLYQVQDFLITVADGYCASCTIDKFYVEIQAFTIEDIDCDRLKQECTMVSDFFQTLIHEEQMGI